jgi:hypothetical protein
MQRTTKTNSTPPCKGSQRPTVQDLFYQKHVPKLTASELFMRRRRWQVSTNILHRQQELRRLETCHYWTNESNLYPEVPYEAFIKKKVWYEALSCNTTKHEDRRKHQTISKLRKLIIYFLEGSRSNLLTSIAVQWMNCVRIVQWRIKLERWPYPN